MLTSVSLPIRNGLTGVLDHFTRKGAGLKVAIIDACRDNPFQPPPGEKGYGLQRGLKPQAIEGSFVIYSAGEGQSALDRLSEADADPNSVFTRTLLPLLRADLPLTDAIKASQEKTHALAASRRTTIRCRPDYDEGARPCTPIGRLQFGGRTEAERRRRDGRSASSTRNSPRLGAWSWRDLQCSTSVPFLQAFAARYADTIYASSALERIAELKRREALNVPPSAPRACRPLRRDRATGVAGGAWGPRPLGGRGLRVEAGGCVPANAVRLPGDAGAAAGDVHDGVARRARRGETATKARDAR